MFRLRLNFNQQIKFKKLKNINSSERIEHRFQARNYIFGKDKKKLK